MSQFTVGRAAPRVSLHVCCSREGEAWRVQVTQGWLPAYLRHRFDDGGQAFPVYLDFEELDRQLGRRFLCLDKHVSRPDRVELTGHADAADVLAHWLAGAFANGNGGP